MDSAIRLIFNVRIPVMLRCGIAQPFNVTYWRKTNESFVFPVEMGNVVNPRDQFRVDGSVPGDVRHHRNRSRRS